MTPPKSDTPVKPTRRKSAARADRKAARSGTTTFRPRARLLRILGEELISDDVVAITELVKNAYDADAKCVVVSFEGVTGPEGRIVVEDDGDGIDLDALLHRWMEPAGSGKGSGRKLRTRGGRRMLGEKGVGRFAVDKLARRLELITKTRGQKEELHASFDWDEYSDDALFLSDIQSSWELRKPERIRSRGTALVMSGLRGEWTERSFRRMCTRLSRLIPPHAKDDSFRIEVRSDEFPDYSGNLNTGFLERSPYRIEAVFNGLQTILVRLNGRVTAEIPWNAQEELRCGPVEMRFHAFDLETDAIAKLGPRMEARAWLRHWSGVSIYRDGFRVWPFGEPQDDWLRLDQRRVNNPVLRLSNNQIVGFVSLTADGNPELRDQTNREGLISNDAFEDLRRLVLFVLQLLETERHEIRHPSKRERRLPGRVKLEGKHPIAREIEELAGQASGRLATRMRALGKRAQDHAEREESGRRRIIEGLVELSAAGQAASGLHTSIEPVLESITEQVKSLRTQARGKSELSSVVRSLQFEIEDLRRRLSIIEPMSEMVTRRRHSMDVGSELETFRELMRPLLEGHGVGMTTELTSKKVLRSSMRPQTFHRLLHVLVRNSLDWVGSTDRKPMIRLRLAPGKGSCEISFTDSGPGIPEEVAGRIFDPHMSLKEGGKGMGLTIASSILEQHGGSISLDTDRRRKGATFRIVLPVRETKATRRP